MTRVRTPVSPFLFHRNHLIFILPVFTGVIRARMGFAVLVLLVAGWVGRWVVAWLGWAARGWRIGFGPLGGLRCVQMRFAVLLSLVVGWVRLVFSCLSGSRCVQLSSTVLDLVVFGRVDLWGALWMDWAARG